MGYSNLPLKGHMLTVVSCYLYQGRNLSTTQDSLKYPKLKKVSKKEMQIPRFRVQNGHFFICDQKYRNVSTLQVSNQSDNLSPSK